MHFINGNLKNVVDLYLHVFLFCFLIVFCAVEFLIRAEVDLQMEVIMLYHLKHITRIRSHPVPSALPL